MRRTGSVVRLPAFVACVGILTAVKIGLLTLGYPRILKLLQRMTGGYTRDGDFVAFATRTAERIVAVSVFFPCRMRCLEQSLALWWALRSRSVPCVLRIGVRPHRFAAHAWVEHHGVAILERPEKLVRYVAFAADAR